ncbi:MAG: hypothetical protein JST50_05060 [Bacteroidetes bacterium]|jgi:hypothetical protein|nr:hypothetical protein [Bacteroidota bacterium]
MGVIISFVLSEAIIIPIIMALIRFKKIGKAYYPLLILLLIGLLSELASFICINAHKSNAPVIKVFSLIECCIILYQLYLWRNSARYIRLFTVLMVTCIVFWVVEVIVFKNLNTFSPYFRVFYAFIIVLLCINQINSMMFYQKVNLLKNPVFIICLAFIIFFLYQILYEASYFIGSDESAVANKIITGFGYLNFFINLMYAAGIYFMGGSKDDLYSHYFNGK